MVNDLSNGENLPPTGNTGCSCQSLSKSIKTSVLDLCGWESAESMEKHLIGIRLRHSELMSQSIGLINRHICDRVSRVRVASTLHPSQLGYISQPLTVHPI